MSDYEKKRMSGRYSSIPPERQVVASKYLCDHEESGCMVMATWQCKECAREIGIGYGQFCNEHRCEKHDGENG